MHVFKSRFSNEKCPHLLVIPEVYTSVPSRVCLMYFLYLTIQLVRLDVAFLLHFIFVIVVYRAIRIRSKDVKLLTFVLNSIKQFINKIKVLVMRPRSSSLDCQDCKMTKFMIITT